MEIIEPPSELNEITSSIIGAAIEVHRHLGPGFLESVYEEALCMELGFRGVPIERQFPIRILYKEGSVGGCRLDLVVGGAVVVELKAVERIEAVHLAQLSSYLKAGAFQVGLLINFNVDVLVRGVRRVFSGG